MGSFQRCLQVPQHDRDLRDLRPRPDVHEQCVSPLSTFVSTLFSSDLVLFSDSLHWRSHSAIDISYLRNQPGLLSASERRHDGRGMLRRLWLRFVAFASSPSSFVSRTHPHIISFRPSPNRVQDWKVSRFPIPSLSSHRSNPR